MGFWVSRTGRVTGVVLEDPCKTCFAKVGSEAALGFCVTRRSRLVCWTPASMKDQPGRIVSVVSRRCSSSHEVNKRASILVWFR